MRRHLSRVARAASCSIGDCLRAAAKLFREIEARVSGGQKPLYRAFADLADGYDLWERFHYRQAWEKLKTAVKAFEMASLWGGPPGLTSLLPAIKANAGFLEKLVLDPAPVKDMQAPRSAGPCRSATAWSARSGSSHGLARSCA